MKHTPPPAVDLPRLMRYVPAGALPHPEILVVYDPTHNLLVINRELFDRLDNMQQRETLRTHKTLTVDLTHLTIN
jgi:hypothetical protein